MINVQLTPADLPEPETGLTGLRFTVAVAKPLLKTGKPTTSISDSGKRSHLIKK
ncbi:MAG: hypothetical protein ICV53_10205 [Flavisolibacter sp.]|nr:hypothetical protein [Flavisolibacter sp.]